MNKVSNLNSARATNTISLTEAYTRCYNSVDRGIVSGDAPPAEPPAKPIAIDYPHISAQPEYAVEAEKLNRFAAQRDKAAKRLDALRAECSFTFKAEEKTEESAISKAETLLAGETPRSLEAEMHETARLIDALNRAILAQHEVVRRLNFELSHAAGRRYVEEHKVRVKRLMAAVVELDAANRAEYEIQNDLVRLGYVGSTLSPMRLNTVEDPFDKNGNIAYYWYREAVNYVKTDAELAAGVRKARMAAALG